jgi:hypothetical protein
MGLWFPVLFKHMQVGAPHKLWEHVISWGRVHVLPGRITGGSPDWCCQDLGISTLSVLQCTHQHLVGQSGIRNPSGRGPGSTSGRCMKQPSMLFFLEEK